MRDFRLSQLCFRRLIRSSIWRHVVWAVTDVLKGKNWLFRQKGRRPFIQRHRFVSQKTRILMDKGFCTTLFQ